MIRFQIGCGLNQQWFRWQCLMLPVVQIGNGCIDNYSGWHLLKLILVQAGGV
jgi:hypothetical protein